MSDENGGEGAATETETVVEKTTKSIVPSGWKSKGDELSKFINEQCSGKEGFEFSALFELCRKNGIPNEKIAKYEQAIADKQHGAPGRVKMTLRNMLATPARKNGKLVGLDGADVSVTIAKAALTGAAAKAKETAAENTTA